MWPTALSLALAVGASAGASPSFPKEYSAVVQMRMPYIPLQMNLRVVTSATAQKVEYYDGLEVHWSSAQGTHKYVFNNSERVCLFQPNTAGPMSTLNALKDAPDAKWIALPFFPDLSLYTAAGEELVGGAMCQKFTMDTKHGSSGTMDDHISFYWDPVLEKPVRWHMHSRHVIFGSHTDEYIMDFLSFQSSAPSEVDLQMPSECEKPRVADVSIPLRQFLAAAQGMHVPKASAVIAAQPTLFDDYLRQYGKSYGLDEVASRRSVFDRNVRLVQELNDKHGGHARFKGNHFLDMTKEEVMSFRGGRNVGSSRAQRRTAEHQQYVRTYDSSSVVAAPLPPSFDWRTARPGSVSPVKDQAACGSCWAYGLTEPIESIQSIKTGKLVELPEQFVVDCTWTNGTGASGMNAGCDGGDSDIGALEIVRKYGGVIPSASAYGSYLSVNGYCKDTRLMEVGAKITGWVDIKPRDEQGLMQALVNEGPISIGIQVPDDMLFYDTGVLKAESCRHNSTEVDHAVTLTGFGTDERGTDYWIVRNSWSTYWGDEGYIKIARGDLDCCVSCEAGYPEVEAVGVVDSLLV